MIFQSKHNTAILAFTTSDANNRLSDSQQLELVKQLTALLGGVTLTEHLGGYARKDNGQSDCEYSYSLEFFGVKTGRVNEVINKLAHDNKQESYILNGKLVFTEWLILLLIARRWPRFYYLW